MYFGVKDIYGNIIFTTFHYFQFLWAKNAIKRHLLTNGLSTKLDILQTMTMYVVQINTGRTTKIVSLGLSYNQFLKMFLFADNLAGKAEKE